MIFWLSKPVSLMLIRWRFYIIVHTGGNRPRFKEIFPLPSLLATATLVNYIMMRPKSECFAYSFCFALICSSITPLSLPSHLLKSLKLCQLLTFKTKNVDIFCEILYIYLDQFLYLSAAVPLAELAFVIKTTKKRKLV